MSSFHPPQTTPRTTRRQFVQRSSTVLAGASLLGGLSVARRAHAAGDDTIRVGLIGCGGRGTGAASQALRADANVKLVAMADAFRDNLEDKLQVLSRDNDIRDKIDVPKERQFAGFDAYQQCIDSGVDLVILATPPGFRPIHLAAAIAADKHVFMEKPVAVDGRGIRSVLEAVAQAKEKKLGIGVGLQRHHQTPYLETVKRLQDGEIGDIVSARAYWNGAGVWVRPRKDDQTEMEYQMRNWYYFNWLCGDHIVEQHIHNLDVINWVKDAYPVRCQGMGGREVRRGENHGEIYDHHAVEEEHADGAGRFSLGRHIPNCWNSVTEHVQGTKGRADISGSRIETADGSRWRYRGDNPNPYQVEHDDLFASIRSGNPLNEGEYGAYSTLTSIMGRMATYSGKMVTWEQALSSELDLSPTKYAWDAEPPKPTVAVPGVTLAV